jgi:subtilase family serine protease
MLARVYQLALVFLFVFALTSGARSASAAYHFSSYRGKPPIHILAGSSKLPQGLAPSEIKAAYNLPAIGGHGAIAIIDAYDDTSIESDLASFDAQFNLAACTSANGCFEKHKMKTKESSNSGWALETTLDVEWAHAIAPSAKILLIEVPTPSAQNLLDGIDYAASRADVVAVSMSFGGGEFPEEVSLDSHFKSVSGAPFFASAGDNGSGASWPASSPAVIGVGGTSLALAHDGSHVSESAWSGSGGGVSAYEKAPAFQQRYKIPKSGGYRAIPDVAYDADPRSGFSIVRKGLWRVVGGTSAGAPQWAAIAALGSEVNNANFYADKSSASSGRYFRDIVSGANGDCGYLCDARARYDYVTGLGTPLTVHF